MQLAQLALAAIAAAEPGKIEPLLQEMNAPGRDNIIKSKSLCILQTCEYVALTDEATREQLESHIRANFEAYGYNKSTIMRIVTREEDYEYRIHTPEARQALKDRVHENIESVIAGWPIFGTITYFRQAIAGYIARFMLRKMTVD